MDFMFLARLAVKYPAEARAIEIGIYGAFYYLLGVAVSGQIWSAQTFFMLLCTPLSAYIGKKYRDMDRQIKQQYQDYLRSLENTTSSDTTHAQDR